MQGHHTTLTNDVGHDGLRNCFLLRYMYVPVLGKDDILEASEFSRFVCPDGHCQTIESLRTWRRCQRRLLWRQCHRGGSVRAGYLLHQRWMGSGTPPDQCLNTGYDTKHYAVPTSKFAHALSMNTRSPSLKLREPAVFSSVAPSVLQCFRKTFHNVRTTHGRIYSCKSESVIIRDIATR